MIELLKLLATLITLKFIYYLSLTLNCYLLLFLILVCFYIKHNPFIFFLKVKYFLISIFIIFPLSVPGEIAVQFFNFSVTYDGFYAGLKQSLLLLNIFLVAKIYLLKTQEIDVVNSIMYFIYPFKFLGLNVNKLYKIIILTFSYFRLFSRKKFNYRSPVNSFNSFLFSQENLKIKINAFELNHYGYLFIFCYFLVVFIL